MIQFENGSTGVVAYYANGSKDLPKEYVEIYASGSTAIIEDFKKLQIYGKGKTTKKKLMNQNKGQKEMVEAYFNNLLKEHQLNALKYLNGKRRFTFIIFIRSRRK